MSQDVLTTIELPSAPDTQEPPARSSLRRLASGRCLGRTSAFQLDLRVDIDCTRLEKLSGDFCSLSEATPVYAGSFVVRDPTLMVTPNEIKIRGLGSYTFTVGFPIVEVTVERHPRRRSPGPAVVQFFSQTNRLGATYTCV